MQVAVAARQRQAEAGGVALGSVVRRLAVRDRRAVVARVDRFLGHGRVRASFRDQARVLAALVHLRRRVHRPPSQCRAPIRNSTARHCRRCRHHRCFRFARHCLMLCRVLRTHPHVLARPVAAAVACRALRRRLVAVADGERTSLATAFVRRHQPQQQQQQSQRQVVAGDDVVVLAKRCYRVEAACDDQATQRLRVAVVLGAMLCVAVEVVEAAAAAAVEAEPVLVAAVVVGVVVLQGRRAVAVFASW
mmetsp:Transcript_711/g.1082  ORF Transcript_711/g.1082 Transcript_711/m.1082 type:complete len:248 (-) Transcript_711:467-1210(-)